MATDATGTPTSPDSLPKLNTSTDAPSGLGMNAMMDAVQTALNNKVGKPSGIVTAEVPVWNGTTWVRSSATNIGPSSLGTGSPSSSTFLRGDGTWATVSSGPVVLYDNTLAAATALLDTGSGGFSTAYNKLTVELYARGDNAAVENVCGLQFNGDAGAHYDCILDYVYNSASISVSSQFASSTGLNFASIPCAGAPANSFAACTIDILNYSNTTNHKVTSSRNAIIRGTGTTDQLIQLGTGRWQSTAALNRIVMFVAIGNFAIGTRLRVIGHP